MKSHKPFLVFSTPRTGSTAFSEIISQRENLRRIGEIFNPDLELIQSKNKLNSRKSKKMSQSLEEKFQMFQKGSPEKYLIKILPGQLDEKNLSYFIEHYHFLCLERKDKLEQIWSLGWAATTGIWKNWDTEKIEKIQLEPGSVKFQSDWYKHLVREIEKFQDTISVLKSYDLYYYEDLKLTEAYSKKIQYPIEKSSLFQNRDEVIEWYEETFE